MRPWASPETAERTLAYLHRCAEDGRDEVAVSLGEIATAIHVGRNTANTAIHRLIDTDAVSVSRVSGGRGYPTHYRLLRAADPHLLRPVARATPAA